LRISATVWLANFERDKVDLAIRLGQGKYQGLHAESLFAEALTPFCSQELLKRKGPLRKPDDRRNHRLLCDTSIPGGGVHGAWEQWLRLAGAKHVSWHHGARFTLPELAMQAAIDDAGVVLGRVVLAEGDEAAGRLVRPLMIALPLEVSYFLVRSSTRPPRHDIQRFREWPYSTIERTPPARH
jgi:LysR family transcriptional regulator, glycine cleavage system transcriptional activator